MLDENDNYKKKISDLTKGKIADIRTKLISECTEVNNINFLAKKVDLDNAATKDLAFSLKSSIKNLFLVLANEEKGKATLTVMISEDLIKDKEMNAGKIIKDLAAEIRGGGGGQAHFATAGGSYPAGIETALEKAKSYIK